MWTPNDPASFLRLAELGLMDFAESHFQPQPGTVATQRDFWAATTLRSLHQQELLQAERNHGAV